jgi:hypothetical protein
VSASWDRTVRIWDRNEGRSKDVYHTKRMQRCVSLSLDLPLDSTRAGPDSVFLFFLHRVFDVAYTPTSTFVMSASDDGNLRSVLPSSHESFFLSSRPTIDTLSPLPSSLSSSLSPLRTFSPPPHSQSQSLEIQSLRLPRRRRLPRSRCPRVPFEAHREMGQDRFRPSDREASSPPVVDSQRDGPQADDAGREEGQGGQQEEAYKGGVGKAESGEEEGDDGGGCLGADDAYGEEKREGREYCDWALRLLRLYMTFRFVSIDAFYAIVQVKELDLPSRLLSPTRLDDEDKPRHNERSDRRAFLGEVSQASSLQTSPSLYQRPSNER